VCVTGGEPGKEDVLFAGRLLRHLGAQATLMSVVRPFGNRGELRDRAERFLLDGVRTLEVLGVPAQTAIRAGHPLDEIASQMQDNGHDLLVLGAPLTYREGEVSLEGVVGQILEKMTVHPVLIVRSHYAAVDLRPLTIDGRVNIVEEIIP
jgi:nucleotide-binding universal stress UspA family protein